MPLSDDPAAMELAAAKLDPRIHDSAEAALERFALAEALGDDDALAWVLDPARIDTLPWSVRGRASLVLGRVAELEGDDARARLHFEQVYPDDPGYADARIALGDLAWRAGDLPAATIAYRQALRAGSPLGAIRGAAVATDPFHARAHLWFVAWGDRGWVDTQIGLAEIAMGFGRPRSEILGYVVSTQHPAVLPTTWAPEAPFLEAAVYRSLCDPDRADVLERRARDQAAEQLAWLQGKLRQPPEALWSWGVGEGLPASWWAGWLGEPPVEAARARLERIRAMPPSEIREERHTRTVEQLGWLLADAYREIEARIARAAAPQRYRWRGPRVITGHELIQDPEADRVWWFRGEYWADEPEVLVPVRSRCEQPVPTG